MRPIYESKEDLSEESKIVSDLCAAWDCVYHKLPISYRLDFLLETKHSPSTPQRPLGFVECKRRNIYWNQYPDIMISLSKLIAAMNMEVATGLVTNFVVKANDALMWCRLNDAGGREDWVRMGGRTSDTRDDADIEPVIHIPVCEFSEVKWKFREVS